jgi:hypothetical protein
VSAPETATQPIAVATKATKKRMSTPAVAELGTKQAPIALADKDRPVKPSLIGGVKDAAHRDVINKTVAVARAMRVAAREQTPPKEVKKPATAAAKKKSPPNTVVPMTTNKNKDVAMSAAPKKSRFSKPPKKIQKGWEKDYSNVESAYERDDEGFLIITKDHMDTKA